jgi:hypothetical protein
LQLRFIRRSRLYPTTTIGTRLVVPLAVTLRNELAVVATLWLARYALSPLSFPM